MLECFWSFSVNPAYVSSVSLEWDWVIVIYWPNWDRVGDIAVDVDEEQEFYDNVVERLNK